MELSATSDPAVGCSLSRKSAALLEVTGVFVVGNTIASYVAQWVDIRPLGALLQSSLESPEPNLVPLTWAMTQTLAVQYACLLALAFTIGWWRGRRMPAHYGVTAAGQSLRHLIAIGLLGFCLVGLPFKVLWVVQQHVNLGAGSFWWTLFAKEWNWSFWLFFAAGSFALVPMIEELFFRGYLQSRLDEAFGDASALIITALFFVVAHGQYHNVSILSIATMLCLLLIAIGIGYVYLRTRSLIPCIILHGAVNFPTKGIYDVALPIVMALALTLFWRYWLTAVRDFGHQALAARAPATLIAVLYAVVIAVGLQRWPSIVLPVSLVGLAIALFLQCRRRTGPVRPFPTPI